MWEAGMTLLVVETANSLIDDLLDIKITKVD